MTRYVQLDLETARRNKETRELAETVLAEEVSPAADMIPEDQRARFWEVIAEAAAGRAGRQLTHPGHTDPAFTYEEALAFERELVPFGQFAGSPAGEVPADYWLAITQSAFNRKLIRYLRSDHFKHRQEQND